MLRAALRSKRSQALLALSFIAATVGIIQALRGEQPAIFGVVHTYLPLWLGAGKWLVAAAVGMWAALTCRHKWGHYALVTVITFRAASNLAAWGFWLFHGGGGDELGIFRSLEFLGFAALLIILAGPDDGETRVAGTTAQGDDNGERAS